MLKAKWEKINNTRRFTVLTYKWNEVDETKLLLEVRRAANPIRHFDLWELFPPVCMRYEEGSNRCDNKPELANTEYTFLFRFSGRHGSAVHSWLHLNVLAVLIDCPTDDAALNSLCSIRFLAWNKLNSPLRLYIYSPGHCWVCGHLLMDIFNVT